MKSSAQVMRELADLQVVTIPLKGKSPLLGGWSQRGVPTHQDIKEWQDEFQMFNVGIVLGPISGLVCIDIDPRNGGLEWYDMNYDILQDGVHEISGRNDGGRHIYYQSDYEVDWVKCTVARGVDFLARGSQVVTAPSIHPDTGKPYYFEGKSIAQLADDIPFIEDNEDLCMALENAIRKKAPKKITEGIVGYREELTTGDRAKLMLQYNHLDPDRGRHSQIGMWIINSIAAGMDENEVSDLANQWLFDMGRDADEQPQEVENWIREAHSRMKSGDIWVESNLCTDSLLDSSAPQRTLPDVIKGIHVDDAMKEDNESMIAMMKTDEASVNAHLLMQTSCSNAFNDPDRMYVGDTAYDKKEVEKIGATALMGSVRLNDAASPTLNRDATGAIRTNTAFNISTLLQTQPGVKGTVRYDSFAHRYMVMGQPYWVTQGRVGVDGVPFTDRHSAVLKMYLEQLCDGRPIADNAYQTALLAQAEMAAFDPLRDYINSLEWDKVPRVDNLCKDYLSCVGDSDDYLRMVSRIWMLSAVARAMYPGCKVDTVPVLTSAQQGVGKSTAVAILGGKYSGELTGDLHNKDTILGLQGKWILEISEMDALGRAEETAIKAFITRQHDAIRAPYGRTVEEKPRRCMLVGTSNNRKPLTDTTGNRRFLMLTVGSRIDRSKIIEDRDQLYAEAYYRLKHGETWVPSDAESKISMSAQASRLNFDHIAPEVVRVAYERWKTEGSFLLDQILRTTYKVTATADVKSYDAHRVKRILSSVGYFETNGVWRLGPMDENMRAIACAMGSPQMLESPTAEIDDDAPSANDIAEQPESQDLVEYY